MPTVADRLFEEFGPGEHSGNPEYECRRANLEDEACPECGLLDSHRETCPAYGWEVGERT